MNSCGRKTAVIPALGRGSPKRYTKLRLDTKTSLPLGYPQRAGDDRTPGLAHPADSCQFKQAAKHSFRGDTQYQALLFAKYDVNVRNCKGLQPPAIQKTEWVMRLRLAPWQSKPADIANNFVRRQLAPPNKHRHGTNTTKMAGKPSIATPGSTARKPSRETTGSSMLDARPALRTIHVEAKSEIVRVSVKPYGLGFAGWGALHQANDHARGKHVEKTLTPIICCQRNS